MLNNLGPNTDPCATPYGSGDSFERDSPTLMTNDLSTKNDSNHFNATPVKTTIKVKNIKHFLVINSIKRGT